MIPREELLQLAEVVSPEGCAISFYYQPPAPADRSHKADAILIKDAVQQALQNNEDKPQHLRRDLQRILDMSEQLRNQHDRGRVIFACSDKDVWKEFDVPPHLPGTQVVVNSRFHLRPIAVAEAETPHCLVVLVDRERARFFELQDGRIHEREQDAMFDELPRRKKSDGFGGFEAGHNERYLANEAMRHFKTVAERLQNMEFQYLLIGCRDETWPEVEPHLHNYTLARLLGRFVVDPGVASAQDVREPVERLLAEHIAGEREGLVRDVVGEAQRDGRGSLGLRNVLMALERGEVQTLVITGNFQGSAVECTHCGHLDVNMSPRCAACSNLNRELTDASDALISYALRNRARVAYLSASEALDRVGGVGALLRFRSDQNTAEKLAG